jgi:hypothetical protein
MIENEQVELLSIWAIGLFLGKVKKKKSTSLSTTEAEYITTTSCCTQLLSMILTLFDMVIEVSKLVSIFCDNTSAINLSKKSNHALTNQKSCY